MTRRKKHAPKRGSLAYSPRKRAKRITAHIHAWPEVEGPPRLLGFVGYKAGVTHGIIMITPTAQSRSPYEGRELFCPMTVVETPPLLACAIRAYQKTPYGLKTLTEAWMESPPEDLRKRLTIPKEPNTERNLKKIEENIQNISRLSMLLATQPKLVSGVPQKMPDLVEIKVGGGLIEEQLDFCKKILGKEIHVNHVFKPLQLIDVVAVTKGKGFQGPVKRWGVKILSHKARKTKRGVASIGPWTPSRVRYTVPRAGQMGFHQRTQYNVLILQVGVKDTETTMKMAEQLGLEVYDPGDYVDITPAGGFLHYGVVRNDYIIVKGSIPGPAKRLIRMRYPMRPKPVKPISILYISKSSKQGNRVKPLEAKLSEGKQS